MASRQECLLHQEKQKCLLYQEKAAYIEPVEQQAVEQTFLSARNKVDRLQ
jgi:hypothetical protein